MRSVAVVLVLAHILVLSTIRRAMALTGEELLQSCELLLQDLRSAGLQLAKLDSRVGSIWKQFKTFRGWHKVAID
jgi:hypothetical protein